ncbi:uncharacterized protein isoform X2 [Choristoneura fumiferana]|uniref:uncharacterized protein isoform X2 n=1 Tax=Choristoneura fumiferana TaxID=7141 RepID=UPI003D15BF7A
MAENAVCTKNKKISEYKESVQAIGNSWIICRSHSHSGRIYYFNTLTGKSAWNLSDAEIEKAQLTREGVSGTHVGVCPEPSEPPVDILHSQAQLKDGVARIYNKQIINNQFSKPCIDPPFKNSHCHQCNSLNAVNDSSMNATPLYNPPMWGIPPPHQVLLASAVSALANQAQPICNSPNIPIQNNLPNCFHIGHQAASQNQSYFQGFPKNKFNKYPTRWNQNSQRNFKNNSNNDLRDILSSRRKDQRIHQEEPVKIEKHENHGISYGNTSCQTSKLTADDLDSSDIDEEWLEANNIEDISSAWRKCSGADCWIVVANTHVMLNNRKFLSKFIKAEEQIFLLTPLEVLKQLRSATGDTDSGSRLVQRARCALRFAAQQMDKVPTGLKNLQNRTIEGCCLELVGQNYHVLFLLDDNEFSSQINIDGVSTFTIKRIKEYLNQEFNTLKADIHENITVTMNQNNGGNKKTVCQSTQDVTVYHAENRDDLSSMQHKEIEIQTEQIIPIKKTVDACIQTDFECLQSTKILQSLVSKNPKSPVVMQPLNTEVPKSPYLEEPLKIDQIVKMDTDVKSLDENKLESEVATKKIRLNRNKLSTDLSTVKKPQFRWRKQRIKPSITTSPSPKAGVVSNNQALSTKSPPSSLISISDLLPPENDNFSDVAKSIEFSDASIEKTPETINKVVEESSLDVISNSIDDDIIPKISKNAILNNYENEKIVMFEITSDIMGDYLSRGCDEWLSRFYQIMEEALSQILQQESCFIDPAMPPPWSVYEAIVCIKTKFKENSKIMFACNECGAFLLKISDSKGKIFADLNPSDFMCLYSYGVHLIEALQSQLNDSEDLQIAKDSLIKLLNDIKNPNLDVAQNVFMDTFLTEKLNTANISELVTGDDLVAADATNMSPTEKPKRTSCEPSPSTYNLRSSQRSNEQTEKELHEDDGIQNIDTGVSFFSSLRLQKTTSQTDIHSGTATVFSPQQSCLSNHSLAGGIDENAKENEEMEVNGPKIIRHFNFCPEIEEKLKSNHVTLLNGSNSFDAGCDDFSNDNYYGNELNFEENYHFNSNDKSDSNMLSESENQYVTKLDDICTQILKFVIDRTTYPVHTALANLHSFCVATYQELYSQKKMDQVYKTNLTEKMKSVRECLNNLRNQLNSVLHRKDTKTKVRIMLEDLGFMNSEIDDTQVAFYGDRVRKYLDQANILFESVDLIATAIREKE